MRTTQTNKTKSERFLKEARASEQAANRYLVMAATLRRLDPLHMDELVGKEVARLFEVRRELEDDAQCKRELAEAYGKLV